MSSFRQTATLISGSSIRASRVPSGIAPTGIKAIRFEININSCRTVDWHLDASITDFEEAESDAFIPGTQFQLPIGADTSSMTATRHVGTSVPNIVTPDEGTIVAFAGHRAHAQGTIDTSISIIDSNPPCTDPVPSSMSILGSTSPGEVLGDDELGSTADNLVFVVDKYINTCSEYGWAVSATNDNFSNGAGADFPAATSPSGETAPRPET